MSANRPENGSISYRSLSNPNEKDMAALIAACMEIKGMKLWNNYTPVNVNCLQQNPEIWEFDINNATIIRGVTRNISVRYRINSDSDYGYCTWVIR